MKAETRNIYTIDTEKTGERIKQMRKEVLHMTQAQLAKELWLSTVSVSKWERGIVMPSLDNVMELARLFGVPVEAFVIYTEKR